MRLGARTNFLLNPVKRIFFCTGIKLPARKSINRVREFRHLSSGIKGIRSEIQCANVEISDHTWPTALMTSHEFFALLCRRILELFPNVLERRYFKKLWTYS